MAGGFGPLGRVSGGHRPRPTRMEFRRPDDALAQTVSAPVATPRTTPRRTVSRVQTSILVPAALRVRATLAARQQAMYAALRRGGRCMTWSTRLSPFLAAVILLLQAVTMLLQPAPARANALPPPPDPAWCFCSESPSVSVLYLGRVETERIPPTRYIKRLRVDEVFAAEDADATYAPGEAVPLRDEEVTYTRFEEPSLVVDEWDSFAWSWDGDSPLYQTMLAPHDGLTYFGAGIEPLSAYETTEHYCTTSVAADVVATALVAADCVSVLHDLAPEVPPKPYNSSPGGASACGSSPSGEKGEPWLPGAMFALALAPAFWMKRSAKRLLEPNMPTRTPPN